MRSYGQYCAAARALDVVGDRWALLVVRELLLRDCRFTDLRRGLPGVATNLLTERLRQLEAASVVERVEAPPPVATTLYRLTERGRGLEPVLRELTRWGMPEMVRGPGEDHASALWMAGAVPVMYEGADLTGVGPLVVQVEAGDEPLAIEVDRDGALHVAPGRAPEAHVTVEGAVPDLMATFAGSADARGRVSVDGDERRLDALLAHAAPLPQAPSA